MNLNITNQVFHINDNQKSSVLLRTSTCLVILALCLLPLEFLFFPFNIKIVDASLVIIVLYFFLNICTSKQSIYVPLLFPVWLILISSLISTVNSHNHSASILAIVQEVYIYVWFVALVNILVLLSISNYYNLLKIWSIIAFLEASTTCLGMLNIGPSIFHVSAQGINLTSMGLSRGIGTFANPNAAGAYLSISFFILLATTWRLWFKILSGLWLLIGIICTGSLGALISTIMSFAILVIVYTGINNHRIASLWMTLLAISIGLAMSFTLLVINYPEILDKILSITETRILTLSLGRLNRSLYGRITLLNGIWQYYIHSPQGTGPNTSALYSGSLHNDYIAFLVERGPGGLIGWIWLVGSTLNASLRAAWPRRDGIYRWQTLALGAGFVACALNAFTHEISHFRQVWVLMAFLFSISYTPFSSGVINNAIHNNELGKKYKSI